MSYLRRFTATFGKSPFVSDLKKWLVLDTILLICLPMALTPAFFLMLTTWTVVPARQPPCPLVVNGFAFAMGVCVAPLIIRLKTERRQRRFRYWPWLAGIPFAVILFLAEQTIRDPLGSVLGQSASEPLVGEETNRAGAVLAVYVGVCGCIGVAVGLRDDAVKQAAVERELSVASRLHLHLNRRMVQEHLGIEVIVRSYPAERMGGDLATVFGVTDSLHAMVVDVSGHGLDAAMDAAMIKGMALTVLEQTAGPSELADFLNQRLSRHFPTGRFATAVFVQVFPGGRAKLVNAGHPDTFVYRFAENRVDRYGSETFPLAIDSAPVPEARQIELGSKDIMMLYSDGLPEVAGPMGQIGFDGLAEMFLRACQRTEESSGQDRDLGLLYVDLMESVRARGRREDDQSIILLRSTRGGDADLASPVIPMPVAAATEVASIV